MCNGGSMPTLMNKLETIENSQIELNNKVGIVNLKSLVFKWANITKDLPIW